MTIDIEKFFNALPIMGRGMLGIFIVTCVIILIVATLNYFTNSKKD